MNTISKFTMALSLVSGSVYATPPPDVVVSDANANTAMGTDALLLLTTGVSNTGAGDYALNEVTTARQRNQPEEIKAIAWKAQHRLHARYVKLLAKGKAKQQVITSVGRELLGFIWAIGVAAERSQSISPRQLLKRVGQHCFRGSEWLLPSASVH